MAFIAICLHPKSMIYSIHVVIAEMPGNYFWYVIPLGNLAILQVISPAALHGAYPPCMATNWDVPSSTVLC